MTGASSKVTVCCANNVRLTFLDRLDSNGELLNEPMIDIAVVVRLAENADA